MSLSLAPRRSSALPIRAVLGEVRRRAAALSARATWWTVFVPLALAYALTVRTDRRAMSPDPVAVVPSAWSLGHHGTPVVARSLWTTLSGWAVTFDPTHVVSTRTPGLIFLAAPLYAAWPGAGPADELPASLEAALITAAAVATLALVFRRLASPGAALVGAFVVGAATTTWSVSASALWPHGPDQLFLAVAMLGLSAGAAVPAGVGFALAVLVRPPLAVAAAVTGVVLSWTKRSPRPALIIGALTGMGLLGFLAYAAHYWHAGSAGTDGGVLSGATVHGYHGSFFDLSPRALVDLLEKMGSALVAPNHGIAPFSPFLLVLALGVPAGWRHAPSWVRSSAIGGLLYFVVQMKSEVFDGGANFWGYRYSLESLTLAAPLFLLAWQHWVRRTARRRASFAALVIVSVTLQLVGVLWFQLPLTAHVWQFADLTTALTGAPIADSVLLVGATLAALTYLAMTREPARASAEATPAA